MEAASATQTIGTGIPACARLPDPLRKSSLFLGYGIASALMLVAAVVAAVWGVDTEQESREDVAAPALRRAVRDGRVRRAGRRTWAAVNGAQSPGR
jgi:hypothetical protein